MISAECVEFIIIDQRKKGFINSSLVLKPMIFDKNSALSQLEKINRKNKVNGLRNNSVQTQFKINREFFLTKSYNRNVKKESRSEIVYCSLGLPYI